MPQGDISEQLEEAMRLLNLIVKTNDKYAGTAHGFLQDCPMMNLSRSFVESYLAANPSTKQNRRQRSLWI
jgi:hypothetical protein